jgi:predicted CxxxxCH...CXXCH cytochrome family protein
MARNRACLSLAAALLLAACGTARDVQDEGGSTHPDGFAAANVHGPAALASLDSCKGCHGSDFDGAIGPSCTACHAAAGYASWTSNCTFCHGQKTASYTAADLPRAAPATGAHLKHVNGGAFVRPLACSECHTVPTTLAHVDGSAPVVFGALAQTGGGAAPSYTAPTCSSVYCHGKTLVNPSTPNPSWNGPGMVCGSCHDLQPTTGQHVLHGPAAPNPPNVACQTCHKGFSAIDLVHHVDGTTGAVLFDDTVIPAWDCNTCHTKLGV